MNKDEILKILIRIMEPEEIRIRMKPTRCGANQGRPGHFQQTDALYLGLAYLSGYCFNLIALKRG
ncbi:MAG: hypothetical protein Q7T96_03990 [Methylobacter sp.]|nr:hypothetical protein [Methylobacter sp.]